MSDVEWPCAITFFVEHGGQHYRTAVFKREGDNLYFWWWLENMGGACVYWDLISGASGALQRTTDVHWSGHASGVIHLRVSGNEINQSTPARS